MAGKNIAISIQGLRRTGKSVLQTQLRDEFISNKQLSPSQYLFYSFETEDFIKLFPKSHLEELLDIYFSRIINTHPQFLTTPVLICLDEIQNIKDWQSVVKKYYDLNKNIKFILTGSSSLYLGENSESLVGRIIDFTVEPLCFGEFLELANKNNFKTIKTFDNLFSFPPQKIEAKRINAFNEFLLIGGFPEAATMLQEGLSIPEIQQYLVKSVITKVLVKDLEKYFSLEFIEQDLQLFKILCNETGSEIHYKNIAKDIGVPEEIVAKHFKTFDKASLIKIIKKFDPKPRKIIQAHPKWYAASPCLAFSYLGHSTIPPGSLIDHIV